MNRCLRGLAALSIFAAASALAGCGTRTAADVVEGAQARVSRLCALEERAHRIYLILAPILRRPAAAVAREQAFYDKIMARCASAQSGAIAQAASKVAAEIDALRAQRDAAK